MTRNWIRGRPPPENEVARASRGGEVRPLAPEKFVTAGGRA
jgi:hypothetical protein